MDDGSTQLGKAAPGTGCLIPDGQEKRPLYYDVLVDLSPKLPVTTANLTHTDPLPLDALVGGKDHDGAALYFCQASYLGALTPGKTRPEYGGCKISWAGKEIIVPDTQKDALNRTISVPYQVLVPVWKTGVSTSTFPIEKGSGSYVCHQGVDSPMSHAGSPGDFDKGTGKCYYAGTQGLVPADSYQVLSE
jgi:hypothetical protein